MVEPFSPLWIAAHNALANAAAVINSPAQDFVHISLRKLLVCDIVNHEVYAPAALREQAVQLPHGFLLILLLSLDQRHDFLLIDKCHIVLETCRSVDRLICPKVCQRFADKFDILFAVDFGKEFLILSLHKLAINKGHVIVLLSGGIPSIIRINQLVGTCVFFCLTASGELFIFFVAETRDIKIIVRCQLISVFPIFLSQYLLIHFFYLVEARL